MSCGGINGMWGSSCPWAPGTVRPLAASLEGTVGAGEAGAHLRTRYFGEQLAQAMGRVRVRREGISRSKHRQGRSCLSGTPVTSVVWQEA